MINKEPYTLTFDGNDRAYDKQIFQIFASHNIAVKYYVDKVKPYSGLLNVSKNDLIYGGSIIPIFLNEIKDDSVYVMPSMNAEEFLLRLANFINRKEN